jgi:hypothetical protein
LPGGRRAGVLRGELRVLDAQHRRAAEGANEADEADEADEPLPDARLDPAAYAAAREAREQRLEARRQQRRARAELKKARRRARADAQKQKQKPKQRRARPAVAGGAAPAGLRGDGLERVDGDAEAHADPQRDPGRRGAAPRRVTRAALTGTNGRMLALALVVFLAAALFAAVVTR